MAEMIIPVMPVKWVVIIFLILLWTLVWKGLALWKSSRNNQLGWFVAMLILNTVGILEIIYIFCFQGNKNKTLRKKLRRK